MWLQTTQGFVSVVEEKKVSEHRGKLVVRARVREHLDAVIALAPAGSATASVVTPHGDYRYRAWITREGMMVVATALVREVTYSNFKDAVDYPDGRRASGAVAGRYGAALHRGWSVFATMQPRGPYGRGGSGYPPVPKGESAEAAKTTRAARAGAGQKCADCDAAETKKNPLVYVSGRMLCASVGACMDRVAAARVAAAS